jgi:hypothetical protein
MLTPKFCIVNHEDSAALRILPHDLFQQGQQVLQRFFKALDLLHINRHTLLGNNNNLMLVECIN